MADIAIAVGVAIAIFGPLLLVPVTWLLYRVVVRPIVVATLVPMVSQVQTKWLSAGVAIAAMLLTVLVSYLPGRFEFDRVCEAQSAPIVTDRVHVEGLYRTKLFPYESHRYLETFLFVEAPDPYEPETKIRYSRTGDDVSQQPVEFLNSRYGVDQTFTETDFGITITNKRIYELDTDRELSRAASINYDGGPLSLLLGSYGMSTCPDPSLEQGSTDFRTFYNLETVTLRADDENAGDARQR